MYCMTKMEEKIMNNTFPQFLPNIYLHRIAKHNYH